MEKSFQKAAGYCLIIGSLLMVLTMVLHPSGGSLEHIVKISKIAIISHSIGILSVPFIAFGFWGLSTALKTESNLSFLAFIFLAFGLLAIMLAAALNGLILPIYAMNHQNEVGQNLETVKLIIKYDTTFNAAMDYIFITFYSIAMGIWSAIIIKTAILPQWTAFYGFILLIFALIAFFFKLNFISVTGFTIYILGIVSWIISMGWFLVKKGY